RERQSREPRLGRHRRLPGRCLRDRATARRGSARAPTLPHLEGPSECTQIGQFGAAENGEPDADASIQIEPPARSQRGSREASKPGEAGKPKRWVAHVFPSRHDRRHDAVWPGRVSLNADLTTVIVAVLGAAGTLSAPLLTQRIAARTRQQEYELQRDQRREDAAEG